MPTTPRQILDRLIRGLLGLGLALPAIGQCGLQWQPGAQPPGISGTVYAATMLPNGDLVVGGKFSLANATTVNNIARYDGTTWHSLGVGLNEEVRALVVLPNGNVVAGGTFTSAGGSPASYVAQWNGSTWTALGSGTNGAVNALLVLPNGDLIAGGQFGSAGGVSALRVARWSAGAWSPLGAGVSSFTVNCLDVLSSGEVVVGSSFSSVGGVTSQGLALWNGASWLAVSGLLAGSWVSDVKALPNNDIVVVGTLNTGLGSMRTVLISGGVLTPLAPSTATWNTVELMANGDLVFGGITAPGVGEVATYNGTWTGLGGPVPGAVWALAVTNNGNLIAAGARTGSSVASGGAVAKYDGANWTLLGAPIPPRVNALLRLPDGDVVLGGEFTTFGGAAAYNIVRRHGSTYSALGSGVNGPVQSIARAADGSLVVAGEFFTGGGVTVARLARWTNGVWTDVGGGLPFAATELAAASGGQVLAKAGTQLRYFDGVSWSTPSFQGSVNSIAAAPEGDFIVGGSFVLPSTGALRFGQGAVPSSVILPWAVHRLGNDLDGRVLAATLAVGVTRVFRLDGSTWSQVGGNLPFGSLASLSSLPNGDPLVASHPAPLTASLGRFDGTNWVPITDVLTPGFSTSYRLVATSSGEGAVLVAGDLFTVAGAPSTSFAVALSTCPANASVVGTGCSATGAAMTLVAHNLPWLAGTFQSTATGFPAIAIGVLVMSTSPAAGPLPGGAPGCSLFVAPELLTLKLPANGSADAGFPVPRVAALAGLQLRTQMVSLELDAAGNLVRLTSSNALQLTVGGL